MQRILIPIFMLGLVMGITPATQGQDAADLLARADQAFSEADYRTALALYQKLEPKMAGDDRLTSMQERMRVAERQIAANPDAAPATLPSTSPESRKKHVRPADGEVLELTLHELGNFEYREDDDSSIPADVMALSGAKVRLTGQMLSLDQAGRVTRFLLVNDLMSCCYGQTPKLQNIVKVTLPKEKAIPSTTMRLAIEGTLKVQVQREDDFVINLFELEPTSIKYAPQ